MKSRRARIAAGLLLLAAAGVPGARAYPIPPVTLWNLVHRSDLVVLARVESVERLPAGDGDDDHDVLLFGNDEALLAVIETWKGDPPDRLAVRFEGDLICPAPPRYVPGETVLAFLVKGDTENRLWREAAAEREEQRRKWVAENEAEEPTPEEAAQETERERRVEEFRAGRWFTVALSYGTLDPDEDERVVLRELVEKAIDLQARDATDAGRREWAVAAAGRRASRWHGLYELAAGSDAMHSFYDRRPEEEKASALSAADLRRLAEGFVREPSVDATLPMMLDLLADQPDPDFDRAAASAIEAALAEDPIPWWTRDAMAKLLTRFGDPDAESRLGLDGCGEGDPLLVERPDPSDLRGIWCDAVRRLGIPDVEPAAVPARRVRRVGSDTPA